MGERETVEGLGDPDISLWETSLQEPIKTSSMPRGKSDATGEQTVSNEKRIQWSKVYKLQVDSLVVVAKGWEAETMSLVDNPTAG